MTIRDLMKAARSSLRKVKEAWKSMSAYGSSANRSRGMARKKPGTTGEGNYYRVVVRRKDDFVTFRNHDVGDRGGIQRLAGKRSNGSWADQAWLISKEMAHVEGASLVPDSPDAEKILDEIGPVKHVKGDVFRGHPRKNIPEREKPTIAQRRARSEDIRKAQQLRRKTTRKAA
jgi:hypothetical protein